MAKKRQKKQGGQQFLSDENYIRQRARTLKIGTCYVSDAIIKAGEGNIIVSRLHTGGRVSIGVYLVDAYCLGLKLLTDFKYFVMEAVVQIALHQPERRSEIIAWFADLLRFASPRIPDRYSQAI